MAQLEQEAGRFTIADSVKAVADKLVRRHPHVFKRDEGEPALDGRPGEGEVGRGKGAGARRRAEPKTLLSGIPAALPALLRAYQIGARCYSVGFDWDKPIDVIAKIREEVEEVAEVVESNATLDHTRAEEEMGDLLFSMAHLSRRLGIEPETALRKANEKFTRRFTAMETRIAARGGTMSEMGIEALEAEWQQSKAEEKAARGG